MAQRGLRPEDLDYILRHGRRIRPGNGSLYVFLGCRDVPEEDKGGRQGKLVGAVVVLDTRGTVVTVYRNARAPKFLKRRAKRRQETRAK
jgi:hypothetical protein